MRQAYEMLRAVETGPAPFRTVVLGKTAAAGLAEDCLRRLTRILGGGTLSRHSPFGYWFEDVRAPSASSARPGASATTRCPPRPGPMVSRRTGRGSSGTGAMSRRGPLLVP